MGMLDTKGRTYKNVTVLSFLLSEMASIKAAFLPDKAWGTSGRYEGVLRGSQGVVIALVMRAVRGGGAGGLGSSGAGQDAQGRPCSPCRYSQGFR